VNKPVFMTGMLLLLLWASSGQAQFLEDIERQLEEKRLQRLLVEKQKGYKIGPFKTDGCSGGQSDSWAYFADVFPLFVTHFGKRPPWEACCVAHDRLYWQGETEDGFKKRQQADLTLKQCVIAVGEDLAPNLAARYGLNPDDVMRTFNITGELMYRAVRVGGKPCTPFSWRWGYGWLPC